MTNGIYFKYIRKPHTADRIYEPDRRKSDHDRGIESRPMEGKSWEYRFFVDFEGNLSDSAVQNALRGLKAEAQNLRVHGNY